MRGFPIVLAGGLVSRGTGGAGGDSGCVFGSLPAGVRSSTWIMEGAFEGTFGAAGGLSSVEGGGMLGCAMMGFLEVFGDDGR